MEYLKLFLAAVLPAIFTLILLLLDKHTSFGKIKYKYKQLIFGVVFGILAILGTEYGIPMNGAQMNARDASVLTAGLVFGGPAGIIAGLIGGIERYFAVYWGVGTYTRIACTVSTIIAGFYSALVRKYLFDDEKPSWVLSFVIGFVMEVFHMTMVFITNMADPTQAAEVVKNCTIVMVPLNSICVGLSALVDKWINTTDEELNQTKTISQTIQKWLFICVAIVFALTSAFMYRLQTSISDEQNKNYLSLGIADVINDVKNYSDNNLLKKCYEIVDEIGTKPLQELADEYNIKEINVVDKNGFITDSNDPTFIGYDMASGAQSNEFMRLTGRTKEYVQEYGPISYDDSLYRKYAGIKYKNGFIQISYDAEEFQSEIKKEVEGVALYRHVGNTGFILVGDNNLNIVSKPEDIEISSLNDISFSSDIEEEVVFNVKIKDIEYLCIYKEVEGYYIVSLMPLKEAHYTRDVALYANTFMEVLVFAVLFGMIYRLIGYTIVDKMKKINTSLSKITDGNLNEVVDVKDNLEFELLSNDINSTVTTLKKYIQEASDRIKADLDHAKNIQNSALPHIFPQDNRFEIYALMEAAKEVGGDFYDFSRSSKDQYNFLVADVSGKGIPGAMFMMRAKSVLSALTETGIEVNEVFTMANDRLCEGNDAGMFVTAWQAKIDLANGHIQYANAGHNPPVIKRKDGTVEFVKGKAGFVLAGMEGINYKLQEINLEPGDVIFLYTDGVVEATNSNKELFGDDRLLETIKNINFSNMEDLCNEVIGEVGRFVGDAEQFDDITMLAIQYIGDKENM